MAQNETAPSRKPSHDDAWLGAQKNAFQAAMNGEPLQISLGILVRAIRELAEGHPRCAFYISDGDGGLQHVVGMADVPDERGRHSTWSFPLETAKGKLVGSFAMYFPDRREPSPRDRELATRLTHTAAILVSHHQESAERTRVEAALRMSEERQAFLLRLSDTLRPLTDPIAIQQAAMSLLARQLGVDRAAYFEVEDDQDTFVQTAGFETGLAPLPGPMRISDFGAEILTAYRAGQTYVVSDAESDARLLPQRETYRTLNVRSWVGVPLLKGGRLLAVLGINDPAAREWSSAELQLLEEVAERTWAAVERAGAEAAMRESEARLAAAFEALPGGIGIIDTEGKVVLSNRDLARFLPTGRIPSLEGVVRPRWQAWGADGKALDPERYPGARALRGETVLPGQEMLYTQDDGREVWTNVVAVPLRDEQGRVIGEVCVINDIDALKRSTEALRDSETRFRQFAKASSGALWIRDAGTLAMEYVSPAISQIYGIEPDAFLGDVKNWAAAIVPEDRDTALENLALAQRGEAVVHEFRIQRASDHAFRWIRNTDFPLYDERGKVQRIGGIAEDVTETRLAAEHQGVLLAELQHRVRNIMAIIRAITARTGEGAESVREYAALMAGRLLALARVQALLTRKPDMRIHIATIVRDEVTAQAQQPGQHVLEGPDIELSPKSAEILTLAVHELATNALKYGALSVPNGKVTVRWTVVDRAGAPWVTFDWSEEGVTVEPESPERPRRRGFGSELIEGRIPYELGGSGRVVIGRGGAQCRLEFPLTHGASVLETGAPRQATVFGGTLDMSGEAHLKGWRVLVVEDEYYIASDTARALRGAGAEVMGPCPTESAARLELGVHRPDAAVLDINLGHGPTFTLAKMLRSEDIPFVFVTGYDEEMIPPEFAQVVRLQKPVQLRQMVEAIARLLT